jgi:tripartite-type tricarboxylate transporter receptor subunit TctC
MKKSFKLLAAAALCTLAGSVLAQNYPTKPIKIIVPYPPGGITDIVGRTVGDRISRDLGQTVIVENRSGAGGSIGASEAARAQPDGYTLFIGTSATHGTNPSTYPNLPYDPAKDFAPVALVAEAPLMIIVSPDVPAKNIEELIAYAKKNPGALSYATTGTGGSVHLTTELFGMKTGTQMTHVPYKGSSPALADLVGGHVKVMFDNVPSAAPLAESGKVRGLAVTGSERSVLAPSVPTVSETVVPGFNSTSWIALYAPAGTSADTLKTLNQSVNKALQDPTLLETFKKSGLSARGGSSEALATHQKDEIEKWASVVKAIGYEPK